MGTRNPGGGGGCDPGAEGHSPWLRMWSLNSRSVANLLEQCEHWKRCSEAGWERIRGTGGQCRGKDRETSPGRREPPRETKANYGQDLELGT